MDDSPVPTSVTFTLTPTDMLEYNRTVISRVPSFQARVLVRRAAVPIGVLILSRGFNIEWLASVGIALLAAAVWIPVTYWSFAFRVKRASRSSPGLMEQQTISIEPEHIRQTTSIADSTIQWSKVVDVVTTRSQVLFFLDRRHALIVPLSAFSYRSQGVAFADLARKWWARVVGLRLSWSRNDG